MSFFRFNNKINKFTDLHIPNTITSSGQPFDSSFEVVSYFLPDDESLHNINKSPIKENGFKMKEILGSAILIGSGVLFGFLASFILGSQEKKNQKK